MLPLPPQRGPSGQRGSGRRLRAPAAAATAAQIENFWEKVRARLDRGVGLRFPEFRARQNHKIEYQVADHRVYKKGLGSRCLFLRLTGSHCWPYDRHPNRNMQRPFKINCTKPLLRFSGNVPRIKLQGASNLHQSSFLGCRD